MLRPLLEWRYTLLQGASMHVCLSAHLLIFMCTDIVCTLYITLHVWGNPILWAVRQECYKNSIVA